METHGQEGQRPVAHAAADRPATARRETNAAGESDRAVAPIPAAASSRLGAIDLARGVAILLMTLDHAGAMARVNLVAERYWDRPLEIAGWPLWILGLVTNLASPLFWVVSGVSVAILSEASLRRTGSERNATAFLFTRGGILLLLDALVVSFLWAPVLHFKSTYTFDLLSSLALSLILLSGFRVLPRTLFALATVGLLLGHQLLMHSVPDSWRAAGGFWVWIWVDYVGGDHPVVSFPVLGWCSLMGLGYLIGTRVGEPAWQRPRRWIAIAAGLLALWFVVRIRGGYGNFNTWDPSLGLLEFFIMSKGPPSLVFLLFNLAGGALVYAGALALGSRVSRAPWSWLVTLGKASLFVYVTHLILYKFLAWFGYRIAHGNDGWRLFVTWLPGVVILVPLAAWYRGLKERHHRGVLRYF